MLLIKHHVRLCICSVRIMRHITMYMIQIPVTCIYMMYVVDKAPCQTMYMFWKNYETYCNVYDPNSSYMYIYDVCC